MGRLEARNGKSHQTEPSDNSRYHSLSNVLNMQRELATPPGSDRSCQVAPGLEIAEIAGPLLAEGAAAILRDLARQVGYLLVAAVVRNREVQGKERGQIAGQ